MFRGLFNRLYVGKNRKDLEKDDIATSPVQLFFEVLGVRIWDLVKLSLIFSVCCLPVLVWGNINFTAMLSMGPDESYISYVLIFLLGLIPCLLLVGLGLCGLAAVTSRYARDMHAWVWTDFIAAVKENWKQSIPMSLINGVVLFVGFYVFSFYGYMGQVNGSLFFTFMQYLMAVICLAILAINLYYWPMMVTYALPVKRLLQYSFSLVILRLPYTLLFGALTLLPFGLSVWASLYWDAAIYIAILLYAVIGFAFIQYMLSSYAQASFRKHIQDADAKPEQEHATDRKPNSRKMEEPKGVWTFLDEDEDKQAAKPEDKGQK